MASQKYLLTISSENFKKSNTNRFFDDILKFWKKNSVTQNLSTSSGFSQVELMFVRKIRCVFDELLPKDDKTQ